MWNVALTSFFYKYFIGANFNSNQVGKPCSGCRLGAGCFFPPHCLASCENYQPGKDEIYSGLPFIGGALAIKNQCKARGRKCYDSLWHKGGSHGRKGSSVGTPMPQRTSEMQEMPLKKLDPPSSSGIPCWKIQRSKVWEWCHRCL